MCAFRPRDVRSPLADTTIRFACRGFGRGFPVMMRMATARATVVTWTRFAASQ